MSETASNGSAPAGGAAVDPATVLEALPPKPVKRSNLFTDPDGAAEEALSKAGKAPAKPKPRTGPPTQAERRSAEAEVDELLNDDSVGFRSGDRAEDDEPDEEEEAPKPRRKPKEPEELPDEVAGGDADEEPPAPAEPEEGTKKKPHKRDDLPEDVWVELKVNGEKHVVNLKEMADDYSGRKHVAQQIAKLGEEKATAQRQVSEARAEVKANGDYFAGLLSAETPQKLDELYTILSSERYEKTLQALFDRRYHQLSEWEKDPTSRARFLYERNARAIDQQRQRLDADRQRVEQEAQQRRVEQHRMSVIKPGWVEGLRQAGLANNKTLPPELVRDAQVWLERRAKEIGGPVTSEDVAKAVVFSAKLNNVKSEGAPPPRKNIIPPRGGAPAPQRASANGRSSTTGKPFTEMTKAQLSQDPDWLMRGTRVRR